MGATIYEVFFNVLLSVCSIKVKIEFDLESVKNGSIKNSKFCMPLRC